MSSYLRLYVHLVWSTWDRLPLIVPTSEPHIFAILVDKCQKLQCKVLSVGGTTDHIHLLVSMSATITIARLVGEVKGTSSHAMTNTIAPDRFFKWQGRYGAVTVSEHDLYHIKNYVHYQKQHHNNDTLINTLEHIPRENSTITTDK